MVPRRPKFDIPGDSASCSSSHDHDLEANRGRSKITSIRRGTSLDDPSHGDSQIPRIPHEINEDTVYDGNGNDNNAGESETDPCLSSGVSARTSRRPHRIQSSVINSYGAMDGSPGHKYAPLNSAPDGNGIERQESILKVRRRACA
jgi:hypothetical protein